MAYGQMTSHELARKLLGDVDKPVFAWTAEEGYLKITKLEYPRRFGENAKNVIINFEPVYGTF